mmetsp:Transcript_69394/g.62260  ORF Transcript_69394/g.62260 Transcript_69394/m.62260 type:complete len:241 (-) Transcript_69394:186-908(-)
MNVIFLLFIAVISSAALSLTSISYPYQALDPDVLNTWSFGSGESPKACPIKKEYINTCEDISLPNFGGKSTRISCIDDQLYISYCAKSCGDTILPTLQCQFPQRYYYPTIIWANEDQVNKLCCKSSPPPILLAPKPKSKCNCDKCGVECPVPKLGECQPSFMTAGSHKTMCKDGKLKLQSCLDPSCGLSLVPNCIVEDFRMGHYRQYRQNLPKNFYAWDIKNQIDDLCCGDCVCKMGECD